MDLAVAWVVFPALLLALCGGCGLLVRAITGRELAPALIPACGLAAIICVGQFLTLADATAELTAPVVVAMAVVGFGLGRPFGLGPAAPWAAAVALAIFAVFAAPVVLSGEPTIAGFIKLDDTATWLTLTDRIMEHGRSLAGLAPSTYEATLDVNLGDGYPIGVFVPFGVGVALLGTDAAWLIQPYMAVLAAILSLSLWSLAGQVSDSPTWRAAAAFLGAQSALLFGYYLWGGVKEIAAALLIATTAALAARLATSSGAARLLPIMLAGAALLGVLSAGGLAWLGPILLAAAILLAREAGLAAAARDAAAYVAGLALLSLPIVVPGGLIPPTSSPLTDDAAQGNLIGPLEPEQVLGVWPSGDFRLDPDNETVATLLIAAVGVLAVCGLARACGARLKGPALYIVGSLVSCLALVAIGSPWVEGKALATASPALPFAAVLGAGWLATRGLRPLAVAAVGVVAVGVVWSNALAYRDVSLAPYEQLSELAEIGERVAGEGPSLMTAYEPYGARHFLRDSDPESVSELRRNVIPLVDGTMVEKGSSVDTDRIDPTALATYRTLVLHRSPAQSRPPASYALIWAGDRYEAWQRPAAAAMLPQRLGLGDRYDPIAQPACPDVAALAQNGDLVAATGISPIIVPLSRTSYPDDWVSPAGPRALLPTGPGTIEASIRVGRSRVYEVWLGGSLRSAAALLIDGEPAGDVRHELNNEGGYVRLGAAELEPGLHSIEVRLGGADLHPGSGGPADPIGPLALSPSEAADADLIRVAAAEYRDLCGREWDWIEVAP